jgi:peptidoglycan/xylan/chitin deacetylase (PgdA/CDA1 family)
MDQLLHGANQTAFVWLSLRIMTRDEVIKLARTELFEIGAHTITHPKLSAQSIVTRQVELQGSKTWVEELLRPPVNSFAYPDGRSHYYTEAKVEAVRSTRFHHAGTTAAHYVKNTDAPLELPRFNITDMNGEEFEKLLFY